MQHYVYIQTFGYQMNIYNTKQILQTLENIKYKQTVDTNQTDLILLNTYTVHKKTTHKIHSTLNRYTPLKEHNPELLLNITNCVTQQKKQQLLKQIPYLDLIFDPNNIPTLPKLLDQTHRNGEQISETTIHKKIQNYKFIKTIPINDNKPQTIITIMKNYNKTYSYYIVPRVHNHKLSKPIKQIITKMTHLIENNIKEIILLDQNINNYNHNFDNNTLFPDLLDQIDTIKNLEHLRFTTNHP